MNSKKNRNNKNSKYYKVEDILDAKIENGKKKFLVKWEGYSEDANQWVDEEDLSDPQMILEYEDKLKRQLLKRKNIETAESTPAKRQKIEATLVGSVFLTELSEIKTKLTNIENLMINLMNQVKMLVGSSSVSSTSSMPPPPPPPPVPNLIEAKKLQAAGKCVQFDSVLDELKNVIGHENRPSQIKKLVQKHKGGETNRQQEQKPNQLGHSKELKHVTEFQTLKLKSVPTSSFQRN